MRRSLSDMAGQHRLRTCPGNFSVIIQSAPTIPPYATIGGQPTPADMSIVARVASRQRRGTGWRLTRTMCLSASQTSLVTLERGCSSTDGSSPAFARAWRALAVAIAPRSPPVMFLKTAVGGRFFTALSPNESVDMGLLTYG